jgi:hypothetical protein
MIAATMLGLANDPAPPLAASESEAEALRAMTGAGTTEQRTALRAKLMLWAGEGVATIAIGQELGISAPTVGPWRIRFAEHGLTGLATWFGILPRQGIRRGPRPGRRDRTLHPPLEHRHYAFQVCQDARRDLAKAVGKAQATSGAGYSVHLSVIQRSPSTRTRRSDG